MPSRGRKFITEFLVPSLNEAKFGSRLMWLNDKFSVFQLQWNHKSAADWTEHDAEVFMEWDKRKGRCKPNDKEYYSKSKQRFRAVLYKLIRENHISEICSTDKHTKIYYIGKREDFDLDDLWNFSSIPAERYAIENKEDSVKEDHSYTRHKEIVIESDGFFPQSPSLYSSSMDEEYKVLDNVGAEKVEYFQDRISKCSYLHINLIKLSENVCLDKNPSLEDCELNKSDAQLTLCEPDTTLIDFQTGYVDTSFEWLEQDIFGYESV